MRRYVVDASVAAQWYFPEEHTGIAESLLEIAKIELVAPDLLHLEMAVLVRERVHRGEIDPAMAERILEALHKAPVDLKSSADLSQQALSLSLREGIGLYDAFYLALAMQAGCPMVTADTRLLDLLRGGPLAQHALWIGDLG
ncbi:MAG TPA: type II toxin-antitoxin system VapC family toxin [Thermoanaerobaculia bacterium]|nr:type II toxin-antitoxin system VapC family toxin [Thermoanaerobaculia bacterium]